MLMVVVLNYCMFIVFSINHVLVFLFAVRKKKKGKRNVTLNTPVVQDRPSPLYKITFSFKVPLSWSWVSLCPAQTCSTVSSSQAGGVARTRDEMTAHFKWPPACSGGKEVIGVGKMKALWDVTLGDQTPLPCISALSPRLTLLVTKLP